MNLTTIFKINELDIDLKINYDLTVYPSLADSIEPRNALQRDMFEIHILEVKLGDRLIELTRELKIKLENKLEYYLSDNPEIYTDETF